MWQIQQQLLSDEVSWVVLGNFIDPRFVKQTV